MAMNKQRWREIQENIRQLLLREWDPIGVVDEPLAQSEYDSHVGPVYRLLAAGASEREIADYLWNLETEGMGLSSPGPSALLPVALRLKAVDVRLEDRGPAA
jgi:hypothetical protein